MSLLALAIQERMKVLSITIHVVQLLLGFADWLIPVVLIGRIVALTLSWLNPYPFIRMNFPWSRNGKGKNKNACTGDKQITAESFKSKDGIDIVGLNAYLNNVMDENSELREKNMQLTVELEQKELELHALTDKMALTYKRHNPGLTESAGNKFNPSNVADMLQRIYDGVFQSLVDNAKDERKGMEELGKILKCVYKHCEDRARMQIHQLLRPNTKQLAKESPLKSEENTMAAYWEESELRKCLTEADSQETYRLRFDIAQNADVVRHVKTDCCTMLTRNFDKNELMKIFRNSDQESETEDEEIYQDLMEFYNQCAECCWLVVTCRPPIKLLFCDKFQIFEGDVEKCFRVIERENNSNQGANAITQFVWPAVIQERNDKIGVYKEGYIYVNDDRPTSTHRSKTSQCRKSRIELRKNTQDKETQIE